MDYEYNVIGSIFCNTDTLKATAEFSEFIYKGYTFSLRKFRDKISIALRDSTGDNSKDNSDCKTISESDVTETCKALSQKYACTVSMQKGYEVYGNANVFNGGSDYEIIDEKWFTVEFDNGIQKF